MDTRNYLSWGYKSHKPYIVKGDISNLMYLFEI